MPNRLIKNSTLREKNMFLLFPHSCPSTYEVDCKIQTCNYSLFLSYIRTSKDILSMCHEMKVLAHLVATISRWKFLEIQKTQSIPFKFQSWPKRTASEWTVFPSKNWGVVLDQCFWKHTLQFKPFKTLSTFQTIFKALINNLKFTRKHTPNSNNFKRHNRSLQN